MLREVKDRILELLRESRSFNKSDVLVHIDFSSNQLLFSREFDRFDAANFPLKILKDARKNLKETGVNSLCIAEGYLIQETQTSPILLHPTNIREDKVRKECVVQLIDETPFINPYVVHLLNEKEIDTTDLTVNNCFLFLEKVGFELNTAQENCLGNFHHHRYSVLKELEELLESPRFSAPLSRVFGEKITSNEQTFVQLPKDLLLPADVDHENVFELVDENNLVIQGPPGTGKSQVLTNLIGKLLATNQSTIVLSEKRVALEVIVQKLRDFDLDRLGYIATADSDTHALLQDLQNCWAYFEQVTFEPAVNLRLSEQYEDQLQFSLDILNTPDGVGGISLYDFKKQYSQLDTQNSLFVSSPTSISLYQKNEDLLADIYGRGLHKSIGLLRETTIRGDQFAQLEKALKLWMNSLEMLQRVIHFVTWGDFLALMKKASICQILDNDLYKKYAALYKPNSKQHRKFFKLKKSFSALKSEIEALEKEPSHWHLKPSLEEFQFLQKIHSKRSFRFRVQFKRQWKKYSRLDISEATNALDRYKCYLDKKRLLSQIITDFCDLGIENPELEIEILSISIQQLGEEKWQLLSEIPLERRAILTENHQLFSNLYHEMKSHLNLHSEIELFSTLTQLAKEFGAIVSMHSSLLSLDETSLELLQKIDSFENHKASIFESHWTLFQQRLPSFSKFEIASLKAKATAVISSQKKEAKLFSTHILAQVKTRFSAFHELLNTPARKLTDEQKEQKKRLKKGKSILVKEFAKTRSHPSLHELFNSEAREWIQLLKPIWLSNPVQIAKSFPLKQNLFDTVIFDEASQIPLQNALGSLQRARRAIVAGDSQQMGPTSYFKTGSNEVVDLLHQASFFWPSCSLKHHYRSVHPDLISFSNRHFYNNNLKAYPAFGMVNPIHFHFVSNGCFEERKNEEEAKTVAQFVTNNLDEKSLGIVAFSEEQLQCIWNKFDAPTQLILTDRIETGDAFFKALENVQGDECDLLIISFGYARDANENFNMRFGPMNTSNGRRRLNVLLTRARKGLEFFSSVKFNDFKLSENESVNLLRLWFAELERLDSNSTEIQLPFDAKTLIESNKLTLIEPHKYLSKAREIVTFQEVMESRSWVINYD